MQVETFYFEKPLQNWSYLIHWEGYAICVDPCGAAPLVDFLKLKSLKLLAIYKTHLHFDHVSGVAGLQEAYPDAQVSFGESLTLGAWPKEYTWQAMATPGHCAEHYAYLLYRGPKCEGIFAGDLLFQGGVGRVMADGDVTTLAQSVERVMMRASPETELYVGHDYGAKNLAFAVHCLDGWREQDKLRYLQEEAQRFQDKPRGERKWSRWSQEEKRNLFLWSLTPRLHRELPEAWKGSSPQEAFAKLRSARDQF